MEEKRLIAIIKDTMPSVVSVIISEHLEDVEKEMTAGLPAGISDIHPPTGRKIPLNNKVPDDYVDAHGMVQVGGGSGFVVDQKRGLILTNRHVISQPHASYTILTNDGKKFSATVLSVDPVNDVAILQAEGLHVPPLPLGNATKLQLGQTVLAIGNALGVFKNTVSVGIVSGLSRSIMAQADPDSAPQELRGLIQTDAAINPGNSGGPLMDSRGRVIGINAAIISGAQNIGLAIPINAAERDLRDLREFGRIRRPYFGVRYLIIDEKIQLKNKLPVSHGAYVTAEGCENAVIPGSPADIAGLREHDIILTLNEKRIDSQTTIQDVLEDLSADEEIPVTFLREGAQIQRLVRLTEKK
jgi:S1-C subfamily serine protease